MNTGDKLETDRLWLLPGSTARDSEPFLQMLKADGDFRMFCGVELTEKHLNGFANYFERSDADECIYSIFRKEEPDKFIGYVGFHREMNYEIEFYISKAYRNKGYCREAAKKVIELLFTSGLSVNGQILTVEKLYATTIADNVETVKLLENIGFERNVQEDGAVLVMNAFIDPDDDTFYGNCVAEYVLKKVCNT